MSDENVHPDGNCQDAERAIWVASPSSSKVLRVHAGGGVDHGVKVETTAFARMLGGWIGAHLLSLQQKSTAQMRRKLESVTVLNQYGYSRTSRERRAQLCRILSIGVIARASTCRFGGDSVGASILRSCGAGRLAHAGPVCENSAWFELHQQHGHA